MIKKFPQDYLEKDISNVEREGENKFKHNVPLSQQGVNTFTKG